MERAGCGGGVSCLVGNGVLNSVGTYLGSINSCIVYINGRILVQIVLYDKVLLVGYGVAYVYIDVSSLKNLRCGGILLEGKRNFTYGGVAAGIRYFNRIGIFRYGKVGCVFRKG